MKNAFSVDLEDWFCVYNFRDAISMSQWDSCELRVRDNTRRLLDAFSKHSVKSTFFVLGWIADRCPELIAEICRQGHEIATHGYEHLYVRSSTPAQFESDLVRSIAAIEHAIDRKPRGYRAPSFSIDKSQTWVYDIMVKHGITYDSSVFPISFHPDYGYNRVPLTPYKIYENLYEFPMGCFHLGGVNLPCCGGGYFRMLPYGVTSFGIRKCNRENRPVVFYIHPWEIDPGQPRVKLPPLRAFRHYCNLDQTEKRLHKLLAEFEFDTVAAVLDSAIISRQ
jgi:polysaccharide deacetylase family protein (PEP-CTERM system associated)